MDNYTATELAYKNGYEQGKKDAVKCGEWVVGGNCNHVPHRIKNPEKWVIYKCSGCGYSNGRKQSHYCPNCGAKMDGGEAE